MSGHFAFDLVEQFESAHARHLDIGQQQIVLALLKLLQCGFRLGGGVDFIPSPQQNFFRGTPDIGVVVTTRMRFDAAMIIFLVWCRVNWVSR